MSFYRSPDKVPKSFCVSDGVAYVHSYLTKVASLLSCTFVRINLERYMVAILARSTLHCKMDRILRS
jgi:hypothetical protein